MIKGAFIYFSSLVISAEQMGAFELARYNIPEKIIDSWISQIYDCGLGIADLTQPR